MIILEPISTAQEITCFARSHTGTDYIVSITDEQTTVTTNSSVTGTFSDGELTLNLTYAFVEGRFYRLKIFTSVAGVADELVTIQKLYATAQTDYQTYSVLDGYYKPITKEKSTYIVKKK